MNFLTKLFTKFDKKTQSEFVSDIDQFIAEFDNTHPQKSASQLYEITQQQSIDDRRDHSINK